MFSNRIIIFIILISISIYKSSRATNRCGTRNVVDIEKFSGYWHYIASVSANPSRVRCGHLYFRQILGNLFVGTRFSYHGSKVVYLTIVARVVEHIFAFRFRRPNGYGPLVTMYITTCNNDNEFGLELPSQNLYIMLSRTFSVSPEFLSRYRSLARDKHLTLQRMNNTDCPHLNKS